MNVVQLKSLDVHRLSQLTNGVQARTIRDGELRAATSTFTQLLSSGFYSRLASFFVFCFVFETIGFEFNWLDTLRRYIYIYIDVACWSGEEGFAPGKFSEGDATLRLQYFRV